MGASRIGLRLEWLVSVNHGEMQRCAPQPFETRFKTDKSVATTALGVIGRTCVTQHLASEWALPVRDQVYKCWQETALLVRMRMRYRSVTGRHVTGRPPGPRHALALDLSIPTPPLASRPSSLPSAACNSHCCCLGECKSARLELSRRRECSCARWLTGLARDDACRDARRLVIKCTCAADVTLYRQASDIGQTCEQSGSVPLTFESEAKDLSRCCGCSFVQAL
jgi:hypothetical protein